MIQLDPASPVPPFEQVKSQFARQIANRSLAVGTRLPTVRQLAADLGLAVNTVARAYRELELAGLVETRGRLGTVITSRAAGTPAQAQKAAVAYAERTRALGVPPETALALVQAALGL